MKIEQRLRRLEKAVAVKASARRVYSWAQLITGQLDEEPELVIGADELSPTEVMTRFLRERGGYQTPDVDG